MSENYIKIFKFTAKISCALFAGIALDTYVQHYSSGNALEQFQHMFKIVAPIQSGLSLIGGISGLTVYFLQKENEYLISGLIMVSLMPYTLIAMMPTNNYLLNFETSKHSEKTFASLRKWKRLHSVRVLMSIGAVSVLSYNNN